MVNPWHRLLLSCATLLPPRKYHPQLNESNDQVSLSTFHGCGASTFHSHFRRSRIFGTDGQRIPPHRPESLLSKLSLHTTRG